MHLATKIDKTLVLLTHGIERLNFHTFLFYFASIFSIRTAPLKTGGKGEGILNNKRLNKPPTMDE